MLRTEGRKLVERNTVFAEFLVKNRNAMHENNFGRSDDMEDYKRENNDREIDKTKIIMAWLREPD